MDDGFDYKELSGREKARYRRFGLRTFRVKRRELGDVDLAIHATQEALKKKYAEEHPQDDGTREAGDRDWQAFFEWLLEFIERLIELFSSLQGRSF